ncbi:PREDICTED: uncharacterized protein LOC109361984 isoform X3 [Lupinus angustifolius]|uniref:uncharacterized protein LOC109361984 isoform X1 n=1 Tax=Lupinus angustifolius TaxID=3871 RepID=UPI00092EE40F|nr:PREDICTED: uncharacterized protein LOC109361984 isoform X1 [Lupinus angustifolius]XP_019463085.1 PREDICTED: uncharacterized protein LOC109361984 isoform X1 [Lupinus angustifolius]XP_019463086.1 PREDICTED: uncharacterized protein LOC109361984 isoform X2 [Lupinus angustifolius]XP_019463087.1 PREDICTED: uncharacterized protein LOC109361984 isoform X2 [Lupinus angustifolius]XP_019463088.1 PREDICTED: uncharacterized protein LOC109361984 isoform X3 [Lupinus angustifolius]
MGGGNRGGRSRSNNNGNRKNATFVEGGFLSDCHLSSSPTFNSPGGNCSSKKSSGSKSGRVHRAETSASKTVIVPNSYLGTTIGYNYPSANNIQEDSCFGNNSEDSNLNKLQHFDLVDSKQNQVIAHVDQTPPSKSNNVEDTYAYGSDFVLGDSSHRGLGFHSEHDKTPSGIGTSSDQLPQSTAALDSSSFEKDVGSDEGMGCELSNQMTEGLPSKMSAERNPGFLSIGGLKLYTEDISDNESDQHDDEVSSNEDGSGSSESEELDGSSETDDSEDTSDSDSDIDEDVAEDYLEGVGGSDNIIDAKWLLKPDLDESDDDGSSRSCYDEALEKLSGITLQEASREYGKKKSRPSKIQSGHSGSLALDDLMLEKDPRTSSARKKHVPQFPRSWPLQDQKSKASKRIHGEKKKVRKEKIAVKRRERMFHRGVDLEKINLKLEQIVLEQVDIFSFQPMHSRDCSQVQRVAALYNLRSSCQSFGKKSGFRFVTVMRTQFTSMPSSSGRQRLAKLMGVDAENADFAAIDYRNKKPVTGDRSSAKKGAKRNDFRLQEPQSVQNKTSKYSKSRGSDKGKDKKGSGQKGPLANQPVSFVSSGLIHSETVQIAAVDTEETGSPYKKGVTSSANIGSFEVHTTGFGSKMLARMGYMEGAGLGKNGQGMAEPIEVIRRPKSLGLGVEFSNNPPEPDSEPARRNNYKSSSSRIGAFEKHTKGFGSKMMAKMGFIEGTGLGRDSQGITDPLSAVRLPKSRGLGAKH